jgi:diguanylate cyclase (GGDEF)-like protein/PAS domain S-box-containing protein
VDEVAGEPGPAPWGELDAVPVGLASVSEVGELVAAREAVAEREALLAALLRHTPDAVIRMGLDLVISYASPAVEAVAGWLPEEVVGRSALSFLHPVDAEALERRMAKGADEEVALGRVVERRFRRCDGSIFWAEASRMVERDPLSGEPTGFVVVLRDVGARRAAIEESHRLHRMVAAMPAAMFDADARGCISAITDRWTAIADRPVGDALGFGWLRAVHPVDRGRVIEEFSAIGEDGAVELDCRLVRPDGELRWLRLVARAVPTGDGGTGAVGYLADVTRRVADERRAAVLQRALDASPDVVVVMRTEDGGICFANDAARLQLGLVPEDEGGRQVLADLLERASLARFLGEGLGAVASGGAWNGELDLRADAAGIRHLLATCTPAGDDEHGRPLLSLVGRDVSEMKAAHRQLRHRAAHDPLTGLGNRGAFHERLDEVVARCHRSGGAVTLLYCDLDGFKSVNDELGHDAGDAVLVEAARRLRATLRATDLPYRLGGDELVVLAEGLHLGAGLSLARRLVEVMAEPVSCPGGVACIGVSVGVAGATGSAADAAVLLSSADAAMYEAKRAGRGRAVLAGSRAVAAGRPGQGATAG